MSRRVVDQSEILCIDRPFTSDETVGTRTGVQGASLYMASVADAFTSRFMNGAWMSRNALDSRHLQADDVDMIVTDMAARTTEVAAPKITYRNWRLLDAGVCLLDIGNLESANKGTRVDSCEDPATSMTVALPADSVVSLQVRPWKDDQESPFLHGVRVVRTGAASVETEQVQGEGYVVRVIQCEAGGGEVHFVWDEFGEGTSVTDFRLARISGPTTPSDVILTATGQRFYRLTIPSGLTDAGYYTFELTARLSTGEEKIIPLQGGGDQLGFTADSSGPGVVSGITYTET